METKDKEVLLKYAKEISLKRPRDWKTKTRK